MNVRGRLKAVEKRADRQFHCSQCGASGPVGRIMAVCSFDDLQEEPQACSRCGAGVLVVATGVPEPDCQALLDVERVPPEAGLTPRETIAEGRRRASESEPEPHAVDLDT